MIGMQSGSDAETTYFVSLLVAFIAGIVYAVGIYFARKAGWLTRDPKEAVPLTVVGVLMTVGIAGFSIGWINAARLVGLFVATGIPQYIEAQIAKGSARKNKVVEGIHDAAEKMA